MRKRSKIAIWAAVWAVVVGLGALAAPAVSEVVGALAGSPSKPGQTASAEATPATAASPAPSPTAAGLPAGYVTLGDGVSIPAGGTNGCKAMSYYDIRSINNGPYQVTLLGPDLVDMGPRQYAQGTVARNAQGEITSYTVAPGDVLAAIGARLCIYNGTSLSVVNGLSASTAIQPGEVLVLRPDLDPAWSPPSPPAAN